MIQLSDILWFWLQKSFYFIPYNVLYSIKNGMLHLGEGQLYKSWISYISVIVQNFKTLVWHVFWKTWLKVFHVVMHTSRVWVRVWSETKVTVGQTALNQTILRMSWILFSVTVHWSVSCCFLRWKSHQFLGGLVFVIFFDEASLLKLLVLFSWRPSSSKGWIKLFWLFLDNPKYVLEFCQASSLQFFSPSL